jgi:hypothetical protein
MKHESPRRQASWGHIVQHTVVGVAGAALPIAFPPDGAQEPPVAVVPMIIAAFSPAPEQAAGADRVMAPPPHIASPKVATSAEHWMPVGGSHAQAAQARVSTYDA